MEKKVTKKAAAKKITAAPKEITLKADAVTAVASPVKKRAVKSVPRAVATGAVSVPRAVATGVVKKSVKKITRKATLDATPAIAAAEIPSFQRRGGSLATGWWSSFRRFSRRLPSRYCPS